jgi:transposase InsO family protein
MDSKIKARFTWVQHFHQHKNAGLTCRRFGISRPTLRKWSTRFQDHGVDGLADSSRRPKHSPNLKRTAELENRILQLRAEHNIGARRIQSELIWEDEIQLSLATIHKVLTNAEAEPLKRPPKKHHCIRYERPIPGDRVQMDTCKIASGKYQFTAIDDCTRYRVLRLFSDRKSSNTLIFIEDVIEEMPFPIQRIQTDRGGEFFAQKVQEKMMECRIKFRPNRPGSPHLNGKVERSQKTDKIEFWANCDLSDPDLDLRLAEWQHYYNWRRPHGALNGKTPIERVCELNEKTPFWDDVVKDYDQSRERIQERNYRVELRLRELKGSL